VFAFIRHGQTDWNRDHKLQGSSDIPLNDLGRQQAHESADLLRGKGWQVIVSSPLMRARETAQIIADDLGLELGPAYDALVERDYGELEGWNDEDIIARYPNRDYPGAESLASTVSRGTSALARIADDYRDANVMIVCHGTIIRYTLSAVAGFKLPGITNGSVSEFRLDGDRWHVLTVNGVPIDEIDPETGETLNP
jgi:probable phosphoglycerate mutase